MSLPPTSGVSTSSAASAEPQYRLVYFNSQGKAEVSRYLFALARQHFVDERISEPASAASRPGFDNIKDSLPFGQLPALQLNGAAGPMLAQSRAIERFLARRFGLVGSSDVEGAAGGQRGGSSARSHSSMGCQQSGRGLSAEVCQSDTPRVVAAARAAGAAL